MAFYRTPIDPLTDLNVKIGTEIFVLTQYIFTELMSNMEKLYLSEIYRNCVANRKQLITDLALLRENPHATALLGKFWMVF